MSDDVSMMQDEDRADSARKLGISKYLPEIDQQPLPANQASDNARGNIVGTEDPQRFVVPDLAVPAPGSITPKGPDFLDQIPSVPASRAPAQDSPEAPADPAPAFLADIPDAISPLQRSQMEASASIDPDHAAKVRKFSEQFGQPPEFIDNNVKRAETAAASPPPSFFKSLEAEFPGTSKFFQKPENMAVAHDDIPNAAQTEGIIKAATQSRGLWDLFKTGLGQSVAGDFVTGGKKSSIPSDLSMSESAALMAGQVLPDLPIMGAGALVGGVAGAAAGSEVPVVGNLAGAAIGGSAGGFGLPAALHEMMDQYRQGKPVTIGDAFDRFLSVEKKIGKQMLVGVGTGLTAFMAGPFGAVPALVAENAAMTVGGKAVEGEFKNAGDVLDYATSEQGARDFGQNILLATGLHSATHGADAIRARIADTQRARVDAQTYDALGEAAAASKLRDRLPGAHSEFVEGLAKDTPYQDIYLPVDAAQSYFQSKGMDIEDVASKLGVSDSLDEARATGGDIKIPLAAWLENMVGTEHFKALKDDIKFSRDSVSPRESAQIQSETEARVRDAAAGAIKETAFPEGADQDARVAAAQEVYRNMQTKLTEAGLSAAEVKHNPRLFSDFFTNLADKVNEGQPQEQQISAADLAQRFPLDVRSYDSLEARDKDLGSQRDAMLKEVSQGSRQERVELARKALEAIPDLHKDDAAEAFGLSKMQVRALKGVSARKGRGAYSHEEILQAAGIQRSTEGGQTSFDQKSATASSLEERQAKAKALGFDTDTTFYHGTTGDFGKFKPSEDGTFGPGVYLTKDPQTAGYYAGGEGSGGSLMPLHIRSEKPFRVEKAFKIPKADISKMNEVLGDGFMEETLPKNRNAEGWWKAALGNLVEHLQGQEDLDETEAYHKARPMMVEALKNAGYDSFHAGDTSVVFDPKDIRSVNAEFERDNSANILHQGDDQNPRGQISFAGRNFDIDLFKDRDVSTFLHETGHYFLEVMGHVVQGEGQGSEELQKDYATILKFLGVDSKEDIGTEQHEKFARAFEQYLSEGKAPSSGLRDAFDSFKQWLTKLWEKVSFQKVDVSPEIRDVFDRMLATRDQIADARKSLDMSKEFDLDGVDDATKGEIEQLREKARARAEETLLKERMKETTADYKEKLAAEREKFRPAAEEQVSQEPLFQAIDGLRDITGGKDPYDFAERALRGELTPEESTEFQMLSDEHGFTTAEEMASKISDAGAEGLFEQKVNNLVDEGLRQIGMVKDSAALREEALKAVHSEDSEELMALEHATLVELAAKKIVSAEMRRANRERSRLEVAAANAEAQRIMAAKPAAEAGRPQPFITMENNAAAKVARFVAKKDFEKAAEAKRQQLTAHALVRESFRINEEAQKHAAYIEKFVNRKGSLLEMPYGFVRQVDSLLDRFGFQDQPKEDSKALQMIAVGMAEEGQSEHDIANATGYVQDGQGRWQPETLAQFVDRQNNNYHAMSFPPEVLGAIRRDSQDLTLDELRNVRETIQTIAEGGRKNNRFLGEFNKIDIKEAAQKFRLKVEETFGKPKEGQLLPGSKDQSRVADLLDSIRNMPDTLTRTLDTMLTTCHKFDGLEEGPAKEFIYRPMAEAEARKTTRMRESMQEMDAIFAKHYQPDEFAKYKDTEIAQNGRKFTKENILAMALNWGNEGNRDRLTRMPGLDEASVRNLFRNLDKKDWDFVQDTWDHVNKYWPEIKALEMAVNGVEPLKVEGKAFKNEHGEYKGGYYPIAYDSEKSADAFQNNQAKDALFKQYSTAKAATAQGHAQARVTRVTRPLRLSLDVLANHHEDIIHDLEFRKAVIDLNRFLSEKDTKIAITNATGIKGYAAMQDWLKSVAGGSSEPFSAWDKAAQWFRFKTTFFNLGYRIASAPKIALENLVNASSEIGMSGTARALKNYYLGEGETHETVIAKSAFMRERANHLDRDMGDLIDKQRGEGQSAFSKYAFFVHAYVDQGVTFPLWADSYRRAMADHGDEKLAVHQADESVKRTFMTGGGVDQSPAMRGSELKKAMTVAYGYQNMMWNRFSRQMFQASAEWQNGNHLNAAATMAMSTVYTFAMPAIIATLTSELMRNGPPSSAQDQKKRMLAKAIEEGSPLRFVPFARDLQAYGVRKAFGENSHDLQLAPLEGMFQTLINPVAEAAGSKITGKALPQNFGEESAAGLSFALGIPKQVNDVAFNFIDWQHGNGPKTWQDGIRTFTSRRHKK